MSTEHLFSSSYDGEEFTKHELDLCDYKGKIRNIPASHAAISTCSGVKGLVNDGQEIYHIETNEGGNISGEHYLYRHLDMAGSVHGLNRQDDDNLSMESMIEAAVDSQVRPKRSAADNWITSGPYNGTSDSLSVKLVVVVDNGMFEHLHRNLTQVHGRCTDIVDRVNGVYNPLNISVVLAGVVVWSEKDEIQFSVDAHETLKSFIIYRYEVLTNDYPRDNAVLLTRRSFLEGNVGTAYMKSMCTVGSCSLVSDRGTVGLAALIVAHELGHNFGIKHDPPACKCDEEDCIMSPSGKNAVLRWSSCSVNEWKLELEKLNGKPDCLRNNADMTSPSQEYENLVQLAMVSPVYGNRFRDFYAAVIALLRP